MAMASLPPNISTRPITWMTTLYIALCLSLGAGQGPGQGSAATPPRGIHNSETVLGDPVRKDLAMRGNAYDLPHPRPFLLDSTNTTSHSHTNRVISSMLPSFRPGSGAYGLPKSIVFTPVYTYIYILIYIYLYIYLFVYFYIYIHMYTRNRNAYYLILRIPLRILMQIG